MLRSLILFLHVSAAMAIVAAFGIEGLVLSQFRRATSMGEARGALRGFRYTQIVGGVGLLVTLLSGFYLAGVYWHWQGAWFGVALAMAIAIAIIGGTMTGRRVTAIMRAPTTTDSARAFPQLDGSRAIIDASYVLRISLFAGIVFLMTVKPAPSLTLATAAVSTLVGLGFGIPILRRRATRVDAQQAA